MICDYIETDTMKMWLNNEDVCLKYKNPKKGKIWNNEDACLAEIRWKQQATTPTIMQYKTVSDDHHHHDEYDDDHRYDNQPDHHLDNHAK